MGPAGGAGAAAVRGESEAFDTWLSEALCAPGLSLEQRRERLAGWATAPHGAFLCVRGCLSAC